MIYQSINQPVFELVPAAARSVLDVGCGGGVFGAAVRASRPCAVVGVTFSEAEAEAARRQLDHVELADLNDFDPSVLGQFDCIVCSHVLEHLMAPERLLAKLRECLTPTGVLIVALPNVLFWKQRLQFFRGRFRYTEGGLMDRTHFQFFDWESAQQLIANAGFAIVRRSSEGGFPLSRTAGRFVASLIDRRALQAFPGLFGFQFVFACTVAEGAAAHDDGH